MKLIWHRLKGSVASRVSEQVLLGSSFDARRSAGNDIENSSISEERISKIILFSITLKDVLFGNLSNSNGRAAPLWGERPAFGFI